jgi:hypothetical protein
MAWKKHLYNVISLFSCLTPHFAFPHLVSVYLRKFNKRHRDIERERERERESEKVSYDWILRKKYIKSEYFCNFSSSSSTFSITTFMLTALFLPDGLKYFFFLPTLTPLLSFYLTLFSFLVLSQFHSKGFSKSIIHPSIHFCSEETH